MRLCATRCVAAVAVRHRVSGVRGSGVAGAHLLAAVLAQRGHVPAAGLGPSKPLARLVPGRCAGKRLQKARPAVPPRIKHFCVYYTIFQGTAPYPKVRVGTSPNPNTNLSPNPCGVTRDRFTQAPEQRTALCADFAGARREEGCGERQPAAADGRGGSHKPHNTRHARLLHAAAHRPRAQPAQQCAPAPAPPHVDGRRSCGARLNNNLQLRLLR